MVDKNFYNTILSQVFSKCGHYLIVGDVYGQITVFHLTKVINPETNATSKKDHFVKNKFIVEEDVPINSMLSTENFLVVGTVGELLGYTWKSVEASKDTKPSWKIELPNIKDSFDKADINCLIKNKEHKVVYAGCGDNNIYVCSIDNGKIVRVLKGHTDYIHSIHNCGNELVSGGEDGIVNIWDLRDEKISNKIEPHKNSQVSRPDIGIWIGAVSVNEDWLLCGGGPRLSLWHLRTLNNFTIFPINDDGIHVAHFFDDKVLAGGRTRLFYQMNYKGEIVTQIPTSSTTLYSAAFQQDPYTALCLAGSSPKIDICSNFNYRDQVLSLC